MLTTTPTVTRIIDTDTHFTEPPDLWTTRLPRSWGESVLHVRRDEASQAEWAGSYPGRFVPMLVIPFWDHFPHRTCLEPADLATALDRLSALPEDVREQILWRNAATLYNLDPS
jgi:predicted TIM-barrel fold metal-dependent hydrolase